MKICIATDLHLSYRQYGLEAREKDYYQQYNNLIQKILQEKCEIFILLGDIFDTPYPKPIAIKTFQQGIQKLHQAGIKCYGIIGNHTLIQRKNYYPIDNIYSKTYTILNNKNITTNDGTYICGLNYHPKTHKIKKTIDELYQQGKKYETRILLLHQILKNDQKIGYDFDEDQLGLDRFTHVFLGHFHKRHTRNEKRTTYHYPGSLNSCNIQELRDEMNYGRGYTTFDTETKNITLKNLKPIRQFKEYDLTSDELNNEMFNQLAQIMKQYDKKPIVQLNISILDNHNIYELKKILEKESLTVKTRIQPYTEKPKYEETTKMFENTTEELLKSHFKEQWKKDLVVELYKTLSKGDIESAETIAKETFQQQTQNQKV